MVWLRLTAGSGALAFRSTIGYSDGMSTTRQSRPGVAHLPDRNGNVIAVEGCTRCWCGSTCWEMDRCIDCGQPAERAQRP